MQELTNKAALFAAIPRKRQDITIGEQSFAVYEMTVYDRLQFIEFAKSNGKNVPLCQAWLVQRCAPALADATPEEVVLNLKSEVLLAAYLAIQELSARDPALGKDAPATPEDGPKKQ